MRRHDPSHRVRTIACLTFAILGGPGPPAAAQTAPYTTAEVRADQQFSTYAYAHEFGSGVYDFNGRTMQVYTLPFSWTMREEADREVGWRLKLPVTLGFLDFEATDVIHTGLPESVDSVAFVPGIELAVRIDERWTLLPYVQAGASAADQFEAETRLFGAGVRSDLSFPAEGFEGSYGAELAYSGVHYRGDLPDDDFVRLRNGVTLDRPTGHAWSGHALRLAFFTSVDVYLDPPTGPATGTELPTVQFESGIVFDSRPSLEVLRMPLPRIGLSYRFAGRLSGIRLVIGAPF